MVQNYLKIAFRNLLRNKVYSIINIAGLALGLTACWLIMLYVQHEKSYDEFLPYAERTHAVALNLKMGQDEGRTTNTPPPLGSQMAIDYPEIEMFARTFDLGTTVIQRDLPNQKPLLFNEDGIMAADTAFLELFGFPMQQGDAALALDKPNSVVLTEKMAKKYFGSLDVIGRSLTINERPFSVTGIVKDIPSNSSVQFDFLVSMTNFKVVERFSWSWVWLQMDTWVRLRKPLSPEALAALTDRFDLMVRTHAPAAYQRIGQNFEENMKRGDRYKVELLPLKSLHLYQPGLSSRLTTLGDAQQVELFSIISVLILIIACVNFTNLTTARSLQRAREVGVRKAIGSQRRTLIGQFLIEAFLFSLMALGLTMILASLALPLFNQLTDHVWTFRELFSPKTLGLVLILPFISTLLGGMYPALYLSKFKPIDIFKAATPSAKGGQGWLRSSLVVFQFAVSITLMICATVVYWQLQFAQNQSTGIQRKNILVVENVRHLESESARETFRQKLLQLPEVQQVSHSTFLPSLGSFGDFYEPEQGSQTSPVVQNLPISSFLTDEYFVPTLGIQLLEGRNFVHNSPLDSTSVILNEAAVKAIGWQKPIGKWMRYPGNRNQRFQVVGVMKDFHIGSIRAAIEPVAIFHKSSKTYQTWGSYLAVKLQPHNEKTAIAKIESLWQKSVPNVPFEFDFLDASFKTLYRTENKVSLILGVFTALALIIGCLGLFALATFSAEVRTKEIGIRKVLGASVLGITALLSKDFLKLVIIAIVIASPIAWYLMSEWLQNFAYHISISWWMFAIAGGLAVLIALLTVGFQSIKAALSDPVKSLKTE